MVFSVVAHAAILGYAIVGFSSAKPYDPYQEALPVEVLTLSEFDQLTKGSNQSKKAPEAKPKIAAEKVAAVDAKALPPAPVAKEDVAAPPKETEAPPPPPEPKKEEPKKAETPPPPPPEPKPADLPKPPEKKPEPKPDNSQAELDKLIKKEVEKKPEKKVEKKPEKPKPKFDPSKIASLVDKRDPGRKAQEGREVADITTAGVSTGQATQLSLSMQSMIGTMIQQHLYSCFNPPPGTIGRTDLIATISFEVTEQGTLIGTPVLQASSGDAAFADSAMRAVYSCTQPARPLKLPVEHYDFWRNVVLDFRPPVG